MKTVQKNPRIFFDFHAKDSEQACSSLLGRVVFELYTDTTPKTAENFRQLCTTEATNRSIESSRNEQKSYYEGKFLRKIIPNYGIVVGDADPKATIFGSAFEIESFADKAGRHSGFGTLSMCNDGKKSSCQFFIALTKTSWLDRKMVVFGSVVEGEEVLRRIERDFGMAGTGKPKTPVFIASSGQVEMTGQNVVRRPKFAFEIFCEDRTVGVESRAGIDIVRLRTQWRDLTDAERSKYVHGEEIDRKRYNEEIDIIVAKQEKEMTAKMIRPRKKCKYTAGISAPVLPLETKISMLQDNPKRGMSKDRYEKYKHAKTIEEFYALGGSTGDIRNDRAKGFLVVLSDSERADL